jgi:hypothetical protein
MNNPLNESKIKVPYLRDLAQTLNKMMQDGYTQNFKATEEGLLCLETSKTYNQSDIHVVNFYRFEGISDPSDNSILYAIEATDGVKGTLVDAYGAYSDPLVEKFMKQVKIEERE